jgi:hypothetical protein
MFKVVTIENKKIPMRSSGMTGRIYAREFKKDLLSTIYSLDKLKNGEQVDGEVINELAWVLAKTANPKIKDFEDWLDGFETPFSIMKAMPQITDLLFDSSSGIVKGKKKNQVKKVQHSTN